MTEPDYTIASKIGATKTPSLMDTLKSMKDTKSIVSALQSTKTPGADFAFSPNPSND